MANFGRRYLQLLQGLIAMLFAGLVVTAFYQVVSRYMFGWTPAWTEEAARYLAIWVVLLTSALAIEFRGHVAVDFVVARLPRRIRLLTTTASWVSILLFLLVFMRESVRLLDLARGQVTPGLGIPMVYVYAILPIAGLCMLFSAGRAAWEFVCRDLRGQPQPVR